MGNGYKILWTDHALIELDQTYKYLELNFSQRELKKLSLEINRVLQLIAQNPQLFPISNTMQIRRVVVKKYNTLYYRQSGKQIEILSFFSNRQSDNKQH